MIGIFDSGIGGLTVAKEVFRQLPEYRTVYFGDMARTPYGSKSPETITRYAMQNARFLIEQGAKLIIVACHTVSAVAAEILKKELTVPVFEVVTPAISEALSATRKKRVAIIGTRATINSEIYQKRITEADRSIKIFTKPCPLFVPLVEEGWAKKPETKMIAKRYLYPLKLNQPDTLVMACTHYPFLRDVIQQKIGRHVRLVDPAIEVVNEVRRFLAGNSRIDETLDRGSEHKFFLSDITDHTRNMAQDWLSARVSLEKHILE